jgi:diazepam-binding inhibitor (GABA receptor modulator, acyl-CoA-binding protein)
MDIKEEFEQAAVNSKTLAEKPDNETLLNLYSLYKQGSIGDINIDPPSNTFDFVGRAKYDAWASLKGKPREEAMKEYIELVKKLKG